MTGAAADAFVHGVAKALTGRAVASGMFKEIAGSGDGSIDEAKGHCGAIGRVF